MCLCWNSNVHTPENWFTDSLWLIKRIIDFVTLVMWLWIMWPFNFFIIFFCLYHFWSNWPLKTLNLSKNNIRLNDHQFCSRKYNVLYQSSFPEIFLSPYSKLKSNYNFPLISVTILLYNVHNLFIQVL